MIDRPFHNPTHLPLLMQSVRALDTGWYDIRVSPKKQRVDEARGYLHGVVAPIYAIYLGECDKGQAWQDDEAWERLKKQFRPREYVDPVTGAVEWVGRSTKGMTRRELFELTVTVVEWLEGQGVPVPPPDKDWKAKREACGPRAGG